MKNWMGIGILLLLLSGCIQRQAILTVDKFSEIPIGSPIKEVESVYGKPYAVHSKGDETDVFEYMEVVIMGRKVMVRKRYFFVVSNDRIIGKYIRYSDPPAYEAIYFQDIYPNYP